MTTLSKVLLAFLWIAVLVLGTWLVARRTPPATTARWQAAKPLERYHQLRPGDLVLPHGAGLAHLPSLDSFLGRHVITHKARHATIEASDLIDLPSPEIDPAYRAVLFTPTVSVVADLVNAGDCVRVCTATGSEGEDPTAATCYEHGLELVMSHAKDDEAAQGWLLLRVPEADVDTVAALAASKGRFVVLGETCALPSLPTYVDEQGSP